MVSQAWRFQYGVSVEPGGWLVYPQNDDYRFQNGNITLSGFQRQSGQPLFATPGFAVVRANVGLQLNSGTTLDEVIYNVIAVHNAARNLAVQSPTILAGVTNRILLAKFDANGPGDVAANYSVTGTSSFGWGYAYSPTELSPEPTIESDPTGGFDVWETVSSKKFSDSGRESITFGITRTVDFNPIGYIDATAKSPSTAHRSWTCRRWRPRFSSRRSLGRRWPHSRAILE